MHTTTKKLLAAATGALIVAAGCSSSKSSHSTATTAGASATTASAAPASSPSSSVPNRGTYTIGLLTDVTGLAASGNKTSVQGAQAGAVLASRDGYTFKIVVGDTTSSPNGALVAAQKMVEQDHVFAVVMVSALGFGAAPYLTSQGVPVVGFAEDGPEWITANNMFSITGALHTNLVATTLGQFFKMEGVTTVGALGYSISPSSAEAAKGAADSAKAAGLKVGYVNASFPFGSTNVQPPALAMKSAGVDGETSTVDPNTAYALITALRQVGDNLKVAVLPSGYGADVLQAGPGALQAAQNVYFTLGFEPVEMHTPATEQFLSDIKAAGVTGEAATEPTANMYSGYVAVGLLDQGLTAAGSNPTKAALISALSNIHDFSALGLWGGRKLDINDRQNIASGVDNCSWVTKLSGNSFQLVTGADPICGTVIPGVSESPSS
ncbi:MAG TPA: ABC transporter substrate-binding protein [Acidimicrobiales bacterium]|nr:ABC transporter substrate-binding protein [Acidimicrobiales bacterium]